MRGGVLQATPTEAAERDRAGDRDVTGCAAICRELDEPLAGTAPSAALGWLLIEHPGPWPAFGLPHDVPAPVARFSHLALQHGVRTQLIRRPDRTGRQVALPTVLIGGGSGGARWLERCTLTDPRALSELDPAGFSTTQPPGFGVPVEAALLVCTHGRREVCCARYGRPVAQTLAERFGPLVWETTHVGGDRFAANLVLLPSGRYFGRLEPDEAVRVADAALRGQIDLGRYRGTAGLPDAVQAAECFLRQALGIEAADAVRYVGDVASGGDVYRARFAVSGAGVREVLVERYEAADSRLTSCGAETVEAPAGYRLVAIGVAPDGADTFDGAVTFGG